MAEDEENFNALSLEDRLNHKSWKARLQAYEEITKCFRQSDGPKDQIFREHFETVRKMPSETNAAAQDAAISTMLSFIELSDLGTKIRPMILPTLIEKGLAAAKTSTKQKTVDLLLMLVEVDTIEPVLADLCAFINHKQPKLIAACINAMTEVIKTFGIQNPATIKCVLKQLPVMFQHPDKFVRAEANSLTIEMHKWIGNALLSFLDGLKPVQVKELHEQFAKLPADQERCPLRYLRSVQHLQQQSLPTEKAATQLDGSSVGKELNSAPSQLDPFDLADPVNILAKLPENFDEMLESTKWKDRKDILDALLAILRVPKIEDAHYGHLIHSLSKKIADTNVLVVVAAANCIEALARGLRKLFVSYRGEVVPALLERCKEKKQSVLEALRSALDSIFLCTQSIADILELSSSFVQHKNPQVKEETLRWIARALEQPLKFALPSRKEVKLLAEMAVPTMDDGVGEVREAASEALGKLYALVGEKTILPFLEKLDKLKLGKVVEKASGPTPASSTLTKPTVSNAAPNPLVMPTVSKGAPSTKELAPQKPAINPIPSKPAKASANSAPSKSLDNLSFKHSQEEAEAFFEKILSPEAFAGLIDGNWKTRFDSADTMLQFIKEKGNTHDALDSELLVRFLGTRPGWKESNFQVFGKLLAIIETYSNSNNISAEAVSLVAPTVIDKLSDAKLGAASFGLLTTFAEHAGFPFLLELVLDSSKNQKNPKTIIDMLKWIQQSLLDFGLKAIQPNILITFIKSQLIVSNPTIRATAVNVCVVLRRILGPDFRLLLNDQSPSMQTILDTEFVKIMYDPPPIPTKSTLSLKLASQSTSTSMPIEGHLSTQVNGQDSSAVQIEDLVPRLDITQQITNELLSQLGDAKWQNRKEALDHLSAITEKANKRIKLSSYDLFSELKNRFNDSNKNLVIQALEVCGNLGEACGPSFEKNLKSILPSILSTLTDIKPQVRIATIKCLDSLAKACKFSQFVGPAAQALGTESPHLRKDLLSWLTTGLSQCSDFKLIDEYSPLMIISAQCLQDRSMDVRKAAQGILIELANAFGVDNLKKCVQEAGKSALMPSLASLLETHKSADRNLIIGTANVASTTNINTANPNVASRGAQPKTPQKGSGSSIGQIKTPNKGTMLSIDPNSVFINGDLLAKNGRAECEKRWNLLDGSGINKKEQLDQLREQMPGQINDAVIQLLLSEDFKEQLVGLGHLESAFKMGGEKLLANLDLILKYLALRISENNVTVYLKGLEVLEKLLGLIDEMNVRLSEYEAAAFLPFFISKVGDFKEGIKPRIKGLFRTFCRVYPASKLFGYLVDGLKGKSPKTRVECLEEMESILGRNGMTVIQVNKHVPIIANMLLDKDSQVRNASLDLLAQLHGMMKEDELHRLLSPIIGPTSKEMDMFEERLKRFKERPLTSRNAPSSESEIRTLATANASSNVKSTIEERTTFQNFDEHHHKEHPQTVISNARFKLDLSDDLIPPPRFADPQSLEFPPTPIRINEFTNIPTPTYPTFSSSGVVTKSPLDKLIEQIGCSADLYCIQALQRLDEYLMMIANQDDPEKQHRIDDTAQGEPLLPIEGRINELIRVLSIRLCECAQVSLDSTIPTGSSLSINDGIANVAVKSRLCRYITNALVVLISNLSNGLLIDSETLTILIGETLLALVSERIQQHYEDKEQLVKALNILLVKTLENTNHNHCYHALLCHLEGAFRTPPKEQDRFAELVMKCLWKMTKILGTQIKEGKIEVDRLLADIHSFFGALPPMEWKMRANQHLPFEDLPLRTVKTILHEIVQGCGAQVVKTGLRLIENAEQSFVTSYVRAMLVASKIEVDETELQNVKGDLDSKKLSVEEIDQILKDICSRICSKPNTRQGLIDLFQFQQTHGGYAQEQIDEYLERLGSFFHKYIRRNLQSIEQEHRQLPVSGTNSIESLHGESYTTDAYRQKLIQMQQQMFTNITSRNATNISAGLAGYENVEESEVSDDITNAIKSPVRTRLESPVASGTKNALETNGVNIDGSSIVSLKERLAKLRHGSSSMSRDRLNDINNYNDQ